MLRGKDGKLFKGQHKPLIELSLWEQCQAVLQGRGHKVTNKRLFDNPDFPLRRFTKCGFCNCPLTACWTKGGTGKRFAYYYCRNHECEKYGKMISRNRLHEEFFDYLKQIKPQEGFVALFQKVFMQRYQERIVDTKGEYLHKMEDITQLEREQSWLVDKGSKGVIPDDVLKSKLSDIGQKITLAKMGLTETHSEELELDSLLSEGLAFIQTIDLAWYNVSPATKTKYERLIFPSGVSYNFPGFSNSELGLAFELIGDIGNRFILVT